MKRRDFLKTSGTFFITASLGGLTGVAGCDRTARPGSFAFPQGVASGDPRANSVVLWTRVESTSGRTAPIRPVVEVSTSADFSTLVVAAELMTTASVDFTVRVLVEALLPATTYYYRFRAGVDESIVGRTRTAPAADADVPVNFAWVSCQDYQAGFYGAYRRMLADDQAAPVDQQIHFVVHMGDFIYETRGDGFQAALDENFQPITLRDRQNNPRTIDAFPQGGTTGGSTQFALSVDDYRHLYRQFLRDPDLQAARARWPFIYTWDDHEFTNDSWQTQANYEEQATYDEPSQRRKVAANQAWFEFQPAQLTGAPGVPGVAQRAKNFTAVQVANAAYGNSNVDATRNQVTEPNSVAALDSLTIYRSLRFGQHVELVITDLRSYRSDHPIPEDATVGNGLFFDPRNAVPIAVVNTLDAGRTANNGSPPETVINVSNTRRNSPPGTMLGPEQKQWWKDTMRQSNATWKIWGSSVPVLRLLLNASVVGIFDRVASSDAWDGYPSERRELMSYLRANDIPNVVCISGDIHAHMAGAIYDDFDGTSPQPATVEFVTAGISSNSLFSFYEEATRSPALAALRSLITYNVGTTERFVRNLNTSLLYGINSALAAVNAANDNDANTDPRQAALAARDAAINPHLAYVDTDARGYGLMRVTASGITATLVTVEAPIVDRSEGAIVRGRVTFNVAPAPQGGSPSLSAPTYEGTQPFPLI